MFLARNVSMQSIVRFEMQLNVSDESKDNLLERLATQDLSKAERRVVEFILSIPGQELALMSASGLAEHTGTSRSTVDRVARKLGFAGHKKFRTSVVRQGFGALGPVGDDSALDPSILLTDSPQDVARKVLTSASVRAIKFAELLVASSAFTQLIDLLADARTIHVFGAGASSVVALDMHHRLLRLGLDVKYSEDQHTQFALASLMHPHDVGIFISYSGQTVSTVQTAQVAHDRGATAVAITSKLDSPLTRLSDLSILTPPGIGLFGNDAVMSRLLQIMFTEVVFHCLALRDSSLLSNAVRIDEVLNSEKLAPHKRPGSRGAQRGAGQ